MRGYKKYDVWAKAHELTLFAYRELLPDFPPSEQYNIVTQLKRACYSIGLNIVEGCGRNSDKDFAHFLDVALGSAKANLINLIKSIRTPKSVLP